MGIQVIGKAGSAFKESNYFDFRGSYSVGGGTLGTTKPGPGQFFCFNACGPDWSNRRGVLTRDRCQELAEARESFRLVLNGTAVIANGGDPTVNLLANYRSFGDGSGQQVIIDTIELDLGPSACGVYSFTFDLIVPFYRLFVTTDHYFLFFRVESQYSSSCGEVGAKTDYWTGNYRVVKDAF